MKEKKDYRELYEKITESDWFKKAYHNKSLGECPVVVEELEESEDERIRMWLLNYVEEDLTRMTNNIVNERDEDGDMDTFKKLNEAKNWLERQKEQKPAEWSEEDEDMRYKATAILNRLCASKEEFVWQPKTLIKIFNWLKSLPERFNLQPKQGWSEEDEGCLIRVIDAIEQEYTYSEADELKDWLKSLRPQPKQEWTEEDEHRRNDAIYFLETAKSHYADTSEIEATINWLRDSRPNYDSACETIVAALRDMQKHLQEREKTLEKALEKLKKN